jgi:hypothetical protein
MDRRIMPMPPRRSSPGETVLIGALAAVFGFWMGGHAKYAFGAVGGLLVVGGAWDWWRAQRSK